MAKGQRKIASDKSAIVAALPLACQDETAAVEFLEAQRWAETGPCCPRCGDTDVYQMKDRATGQRNKRFLWRCKGCKRQYTVRVGTVYEDSAIPLKHWCYAFWAACASKKGVSALQIKRQTGLTYKSALFLMHRIRWAMAEDDGEAERKLEGTVEVDETYIGGKPRYPKKIGMPQPLQPAKRKIPVVSLVERGGSIRSLVLPRVTASILRDVLEENIDPNNARLMTDESQMYKTIGRLFSGGHQTVNHSFGEYARGDVTTNTVEGVFSLLKRGLYGTYHAVSLKHLHRYLAEFDFRYNHRQIEDGQRTAIAIRRAEGKRLLYRAPVVGQFEI
jgi:transposase-like protein